MRAFLLLLGCSVFAGAQQRFYVATSGDAKVAVVDGVAGRVAQQFPVSGAPQSVAISIDGRQLFVSSEAKSGVDVLDRITGKAIRTIPVGNKPDCIMLAPEGRKLFVAVRGEAKVVVIDTATLEKEKTIFTGKEPGGLAVTPDNTRMIVALAGDHKLSVINIRTEAIEFDISVNGAPVAVAIESDKSLVIHRLFVLLATGDVETVDWAQRKAGGKVAGPARGVVVSPDRRTLWTAGGDAVQVYSLPDLKKIATVPVGKGAATIAFTQDGRHAAVVSETEGTLSVIDAAAYREMSRVAVGNSPRGIAVTE